MHQPVLILSDFPSVAFIVSMIDLLCLQRHNPDVIIWSNIINGYNFMSMCDLKKCDDDVEWQWSNEVSK